MAQPSKLLNAYELMVAAEEEKRRLMPERLVTLVADKPWIRAVSQHSQARQAFLEAAIDFCRSEKAKTRKPRGVTHAKLLAPKNAERVSEYQDYPCGM